MALTVQHLEPCRLPVVRVAVHPTPVLVAMVAMGQLVAVELAATQRAVQVVGADGLVLIADWWDARFWVLCRKVQLQLCSSGF